MIITVKGIDKTIKDLRKLGEKGDKLIANITKVNADDIEAMAKSLAPVDTGKLRQFIRSEKITPTRYKIVSGGAGTPVNYAAYLEFGTGQLVSVPNELKEVAFAFKGNGQGRVSISPQPYLYPAFVKGRQQYLKDLQKGLNNLVKKV